MHHVGERLKVFDFRGEGTESNFEVLGVTTGKLNTVMNVVEEATGERLVFVLINDAEEHSRH